MRIERATPDDAPEILALQRLAFQSEAELYGDPSLAPMTQTVEDLRASFAALTVLKAVEGGTDGGEGRALGGGRKPLLVGSVRARLVGATCHIGRLVVHPAHQNRGIGTALMRAIEAAHPQAARFELFTGHRSTRNLHLYGKLGYEAYDRRPDPATGDVVMVFMRKLRTPTSGGS